MNRHRIDRVLGIVHEFDARRLREQRARLGDGERLLELGVDGDAVAVEDRHAHGGRGDADGGVAQDLVRLAAHLDLLGALAGVVLERADRRHHVEAIWCG